MGGTALVWIMFYSTALVASTRSLYNSQLFDMSIIFHNKMGRV